MGIKDRDYYRGGDPTPHWHSEEQERERQRQLHAASQIRLSRAIESNWRTGRTGRKAQSHATADYGMASCFGVALLFLGALIWGAKIIRWITQLFGADTG